MKIQTTALIKKISIEGKSVDIKEGNTIDLEFSAIDTGGGFKDPILDYSFTVGGSMTAVNQIALTLVNPQKENHEATVTISDFEYSDGQINGRLKGDDLPKELIGFILQLLR